MENELAFLRGESVLAWKVQSHRSVLVQDHIQGLGSPLRFLRIEKWGAMLCMHTFQSASGGWNMPARYPRLGTPAPAQALIYQEGSTA